MNMDRYFGDWERAMWPEDGSIIVRSRMVTEEFRVEYLDDGGYQLIKITEKTEDE